MAEKKVCAAGLSNEELRKWIEPNHSRLSIARQCELIGLSRSSRCFTPQGETAENLTLMKQIDTLYMKWPFYGSRKLSLELGVNRKRIRVQLPRAASLSSLISRRSALA